MIKTKNAESDKKVVNREMTDEQRNAICYKSKLLNKYFEDYDELVAAEDEYKKAHEAELKAKEERKAEAEGVKAAIQARTQIELEAKKAKTEAYKAYLEACEQADSKVAAAKKTESEKLQEFCKKHPEGFHDTVTVGDMTYRYDYVSNSSVSYVDPFLRVLSWF